MINKMYGYIAAAFLLAGLAMIALDRFGWGWAIGIGLLLAWASEDVNSDQEAGKS